MKILVTGATGFLGCPLVDILLKEGHRVIASSKDPEKAWTKSWFSGVLYLPLDIKSPLDDPFGYFHEPDLLIHLAWEGLPCYEDLFHFEKNLPNHYRFLKAMIEGGLKSLLVAGTCLEYGLRDGCLTEDMDSRPNTAYGLAKDTLRKSLELLRKNTPFSLKWVRYFYLYCQHQASRGILSELDHALDRGEPVFNMSDGQQLRDYLPVETAARYTAKIAFQEKIQGIINCSSGRPVSIRVLVEEHLKRRGRHIRLNLGHYPYPEYEPMAFWGDTRRLQEALEDRI
jgi:nucleoside-diphosphate-sugar epimerase